MPDRITIYRNPTLAMCESEDEVVEEVWQRFRDALSCGKRACGQRF